MGVWAPAGGRGRRTRERRRQGLPGGARPLVALAVILVLLATTGWTATLSPRAAKDAMAAALAAWTHGTVGARRLPDPDAPPGAVARFFASLTGAQRLGLARRYPLVVGNLDGVDPALRYGANRLALTRQRAAALADKHSDALTPVGRAAMTELADRYTSLLAGHRQILAFDPTGDGHIAEVLGDLRTATHVAVVVPGVATDLADFERDDAKRYAATAGMARALYGAERLDRPDARTAVIAWAGYTAPDGLGLEASTGTLAARGAVRLESLLAALPAAATWRCSATPTVRCCAGWPLRTCRPAGSATSPSWAVRACVPATSPPCTPPRTSGRPGTPGTGSATCRTWSSPGSATAPTRSPAASAPG